MEKTKKPKVSQESLNEKENNLLRLIRGIQFGEIRIIIQDGLPVRVEEMKKSLKL